MSDEQFFFDEFFAADEPIEIVVAVRGQEVPLKVRPSLTLEERVKAESSAIKRKIDPKTGKITIDRVDEGRAAIELALAYLVSWPFVTRDGSPVPITRENINKFIGAQQLVEIIGQATQNGGDLTPFAKASGAA